MVRRSPRRSGSPALLEMGTKERGPRDIRLASTEVSATVCLSGPVAPSNLHSCLGFRGGRPFRWALGPPEPPHQHSQLAVPTVLAGAPSWPYGFPRGPRVGSLTQPFQLLGATRNLPAATPRVKATNLQARGHTRRSQ